MRGGGCLIATGAGDGGSTYNAGLFYTLEEGSETTFVPMAGEQYQLSFMVNFLDGTTNNVYMDINEGALGRRREPHRRVEKVSFTFTAPSADPLKIRCVVNGLPEGKRVGRGRDLSDFPFRQNHQPDDAAAAQSGVDKETTLLGDNLLDNGDFNKASISNGGAVPTGTAATLSGRTPAAWTIPAA